MPESWEVLTKFEEKPQDEQKDVRATIHRDMQAFLAQQLNGLLPLSVLNPQNGDVLGMYSNPSYSLAEAQDRQLSPARSQQARKAASEPSNA